MLNKVVTALTNFAKNTNEKSACISIHGEIKIPKALRK
jgi:hypothetical protein